MSATGPGSSAFDDGLQSLPQAIQDIVLDLIAKPAPKRIIINRDYKPWRMRLSHDSRKRYAKWYYGGTAGGRNFVVPGGFKLAKWLGSLTAQHRGLIKKIRTEIDWHGRDERGKEEGMEMWQETAYCLLQAHVEELKNVRLEVENAKLEINIPGVAPGGQYLAAAEKWMDLEAVEEWIGDHCSEFDSEDEGVVII